MVSKGKKFGDKEQLTKKSAITMRRERTTSDKMKDTIKRAKSMWERLRRWVESLVLGMPTLLNTCRHDLQEDARALLRAELMELITDNLFEVSQGGKRF